MVDSRSAVRGGEAEGSTDTREGGGSDGIAAWVRVWRSIRGRRGDHGDAVPGLVAVAVLSPAMFAAVAHLAEVSVIGGAALGTLFALLAWFHVLLARVEGWGAGEGVVFDGSDERGDR